MAAALRRQEELLKRKEHRLKLAISHEKREWKKQQAEVQKNLELRVLAAIRAPTKRFKKSRTRVSCSNRAVNEQRKMRLVGSEDQIHSPEVAHQDLERTSPKAAKDVETLRAAMPEQVKQVMDGLPGCPLSPRLVQTLDSLLQGDSEKQVAYKLKISQHTVHVYIKTLYRRFNVSSRAELMSQFTLSSRRSPPVVTTG